MWTETGGHHGDGTEHIFPQELLGSGSEASHHHDRLLDTRAAAGCVCTQAGLSVK